MLPVRSKHAFLGTDLPAIAKARLGGLALHDRGWSSQTRSLSLQTLTQLSQLTSFSVASLHRSDDMWAALGAMPQLRQLHLGLHYSLHHMRGPDQLPFLSALTGLTNLSVPNSTLDVHLLRNLEEMPHLRALRVRNLINLFNYVINFLSWMALRNAAQWLIDMVLTALYAVEMVVCCCVRRPPALGAGPFVTRNCSQPPTSKHDPSKHGRGPCFHCLISFGLSTNQLRALDGR